MELHSWVQSHGGWRSTEGGFVQVLFYFLVLITIPPLLPTHLVACAVGLTTQRIITRSVCRLCASSLTRRWDGYGVRELRNCQRARKC
jgi:hypothetical protein